MEAEEVEAEIMEVAEIQQITVLEEVEAGVVDKKLEALLKVEVVDRKLEVLVNARSKNCVVMYSQNSDKCEFFGS